jgi:hypothetical protein
VVIDWAAKNCAIGTHSGHARRGEWNWLAELWWSNGGQIGGQTLVVGDHPLWAAVRALLLTCSNWRRGWDLNPR